MRFFLVFAVICLARAVEPATRPDTSAFEGLWLGRVTAPNASTEIGFALTKTEKGLLTRFHMPAMFVADAPLGPAQLDGTTLRVRPLDTELRREGDALVGTFGLSQLPVELRRAEKFGTVPPAPKHPAGPEPRWSTALHAETWASPVARDGIVYLGTVDGRCHALDAKTGAKIWESIGANPIYGTAFVTATHVYLVDARAELVALERAHGTERWRARLYDETAAGGPLPANPTFNRRTPVPVLIDGTLYVGSLDQGVYALDEKTGALRWRHDAKSKLAGTAGVAGDALWFGGLDGTVFALDRGTRREIVRAKLPGGVTPAPLAIGDVVIAGCRDYTLYGLRRDDLSVKWRFSFWFSWVESTPTVADGVLYVGGSDFARVTALDPERGAAKWSTIVHGLTWGTPLVTERTVYAGTSAQRGAIIPHEGGLVALDRESGAVKWRRIVPLAGDASRAGYLGSLARAGDLVIGAAFDGTVSAFAIE